MKIIKKKIRKIAFILPSLKGGGAEKVFINLAISLANKKNKITLISISRNNDYYLDWQKYNINFIEFNKKKIIYSFFEIINFFKKNKFDVIFSTIIHLNILMFFLNKFFIKQKIILRESNNLELNLYDKNFIVKLFYRLFIPIVYKNRRDF